MYCVSRQNYGQQLTGPIDWEKSKQKGPNCCAAAHSKKWSEKHVRRNPYALGGYTGKAEVEVQSLISA